MVNSLVGTQKKGSKKTLKSILTGHRRVGPDKQPKLRRSVSGVSMVETVIALPVLLLMGLSGWQMILLYEAKTVLNHATFMAARAGSMDNMSFPSMYQAFDDAIRIVERNDGVRALRGRDDPQNIADIYVANPTQEVFVGGDTWADPIGGNVFELSNSLLGSRDHTVLRSGGINIQDANLLRIRVVYNFELRIPVVSTILSSLVVNQSANQGRPYYPLNASATVRMQSPARYNSNGPFADDVLVNACVDFLADGSGAQNLCPTGMFNIDSTLDHDLQIFARGN